jgi:hypothetical protein
LNRVLITLPSPALRVIRGCFSCRCTTIDGKKIGRNAWANYYQMVAQVAYLEKLEAELGAAGVPNVVFMDTDMMVRGTTCAL